jgi:hypothetical protein
MKKELYDYTKVKKDGGVDKIRSKKTGVILSENG